MNTSVSALQTYQAMINVANSNIANVNTDGYCRQTAVVNEIQSNSTSSGATGTGVEVTNVKRISDAFTLKHICSANTASGKSETELNYLESVEAVFNESSGSGVSSALSGFFNAWQDLANDPSGSTARSTVISKAGTLASTLNDTYGELKDIRNGINDDVSQTVNDINGITNQIADLNQQILEAKAGGTDANTLLDTRDSLLTELSSKVDIASYQDDSGQLNIQLSNGKSLVRGSTSYELGATTNSTTGLSDITWVDRNGNETVVTDSISGGSLGGEIDVMNNVIPEYLDQLDTLAATIMDQVNTLHENGYDAKGDAGLAFFTGTGAGDIAVNNNIVNDTDLVAAASTSAGAPGDGTIATEIVALQDSSLMDDGSTLDEYFGSIVSNIGTQVADSTSSSTTQSDLVSFYKNLRESVSGVDSDEELANIALYQNAYEAAAKVMSVLDELLQTIIDM